MEHEFIQELTTQKERKTFSWCYGHISHIMGSVGYSNLSLLRLFHLTSQTSNMLDLSFSFIIALFALLCLTLTLFGQIAIKSRFIGS